MAVNIEKNDMAFNTQLKNFASKIGTYGPTLGLTAAEIAAIKTDSVAFDYVLTNQVSTQTFAQNYTSFKNLLRKGGEQSLGSLPVLAAFATAPAMPAANIDIRFRSTLQRITRHVAYTTAMGEDLGIEAPMATFAATNGKPSFFIEFSSGGYPNLRWVKGKFDGVEIWKDDGRGFIKLDRDMKPDYIDKSSLPTLGASAVWKYKMIYIHNDEITGQWSDVANVTVHGEV